MVIRLIQLQIHNQKLSFKWRKNLYMLKRFILKLIQLKLKFQFQHMKIRPNMVFLISLEILEMSTQQLDSQSLQAIKPSPSIHKIILQSNNLITLLLNRCIPASKTLISMLLKTNKTTLLLLCLHKVTR